MNKRNLKLFVVPAIYVMAILVFGTSMYLIQKAVNNSKFTTDEEMEYVDKELVTDNEYIPVINVATTILRPYLIDGITINKTFYDENDDATSQENSIILYEDLYMQNTGVDYKYTDTFDIVSVLDGTVIEITDNAALGKTIKIKHNNSLISTYQCLSEVDVKVEDQVLRGQIIGKSGTCNLYKEDSNLHFELSLQGKNINPEKAYDKTEDEL